MMCPFYYNEQTLIAMKQAYNNSIIIEKSQENDLYNLYPTNSLDLNFNKRQYIALPINIDINNNNIRQKYNIV